MLDRFTIPEGADTAESVAAPPPPPGPDFDWRITRYDLGDGLVTELAGGRARAIILPAVAATETADCDRYELLVGGTADGTILVCVGLDAARATAERLIRRWWPEYFPRSESR